MSISLIGLALLVGASIGLTLGMLGGGGSILTVPALVYVLGLSAHDATTSSLVIVGLNAAFGAWLNCRRGPCMLRHALVFGGIGLGAAFLGARVSQYIPEVWLLTLFGSLMLIIGSMMLRPKVQAKTDEQAIAWPAVVMGGLGVGFLTGFLGVGGGFLIVPALVLLLHMPMRTAISSSLIVIALNSSAGILGHLQGSHFDWTLIGLIISGGVVGNLLGTRFAQKVQVQTLQRSFAFFVIALGIFLVIKNFPLA